MVAVIMRYSLRSNFFLLPTFSIKCSGLSWSLKVTNPYLQSRMKLVRFCQLNIFILNVSYTFSWYLAYTLITFQLINPLFNHINIPGQRSLLVQCNADLGFCLQSSEISKFYSGQASNGLGLEHFQAKSVEIIEYSNKQILIVSFRFPVFPYQLCTRDFSTFWLMT